MEARRWILEQLGGAVKFDQAASVEDLLFQSSQLSGETSGGFRTHEDFVKVDNCPQSV